MLQKVSTFSSFHLEGVLPCKVLATGDVQLKDLGFEVRYGDRDLVLKVVDCGFGASAAIFPGGCVMSNF